MVTSLVGFTVVAQAVGQEGPPWQALSVAVSIATGAYLLLRVGLLAFTAFIYFAMSVSMLLPGVPAGSWAVKGQLAALALWIGLLAWAAWVSMAGRPILAGLLEEEGAD